MNSWKYPDMRQFLPSFNIGFTLLPQGVVDSLEAQLLNNASGGSIQRMPMLRATVAEVFMEVLLLYPGDGPNSSHLVFGKRYGIVQASAGEKPRICAFLPNGDVFG